MVYEYISYYRAFSVGLCVGTARNVTDGFSFLFRTTNFSLQYILFQNDILKQYEQF